MTTSSEDVLLSVAHVRYKKGDGTLYVMNERIAWMVEHRDTVAVAHKYADIKTQKISPAGKPKVQLQVVLHDGACSTFHFVNPAGAEAQASDRDRVKNQLQNLLPQFRRQVNKELEEKSRLLSLHPTLKHLYEDLVITKVLSSEEYWNTPTIKQHTESQAEKQEVGVSGAFLADIKPQTDGCNGLKYNLTQEIIEAIFKTYPAVHKKHTDYVPSKMTESVFWTKFFQSHYFHRDRITTVSKDLFTECGRLDDLHLGRAMASGSGDPLLEMSRWAEPDPLVEEALPTPADATSVPRSMIKRFNQHSIMVLKAGENSLNAATTQLDDNKNEKKPESNGVNSSGTPEKKDEDRLAPPPTKRQRILEKISYDDLGGGSEEQAMQQLELSKIERYLHGPTNADSAAPVLAGNPSGQRSTARTVRALVLSWVAGAGVSRPMQPSAQAAVGVLGELSPGGALMRHHHSHSLAQLVPPDVEAEVRRLYLGGGELLRVFWQCFQPTKNALPPDSEKVSRAHEALQRFKIARLKPFEDRMVRELSPLAHSLTKHLSQLLQSATAKFNLWQSRQAKLR